MLLAESFDFISKYNFDVNMLKNPENKLECKNDLKNSIFDVRI
jgi:hypothetical protein